MTNYEIADRFMILYFPEQHEAGEAMPQWYQHITLLPWIVGYPDVERLEHAAAEQKPFEATVSRQTHFGPAQNIPVWLVEPADMFRQIHEALRSAAGGAWFESGDGHYVGADYTPHITPKPNQPELHGGEQLHIGAITLVERRDNVRKIVRHLPLKGEESHDQATA